MRKSSNNWGDLINRPLLAIGDILSFILFALIGRTQHGEVGNIFDVVTTTFPFLITWLIISPLFGAYSRQATSSIGALPLAVIPSLLLSTIGGVGIRSLIKGYIPPMAFGIVTLLVTSVLIISWRSLYIKLFGGTNDNANENKDAGVFEVFKMIGTLIKRW